MTAAYGHDPCRSETGDRHDARRSENNRQPAEKRVAALAPDATVAATPPGPDDFSRRAGSRPSITAPARLTPLLTVAEVAEHLKVATRTVRRAIKKGEMHFHLVGRQIRIPQDEVAAFLARRWW
jgi:excisionase family DNA binding protein